MATWKRDFASGLVVLVPILVVTFVLVWLYSNLARIPVPGNQPRPIRVALTLLVFILLVFAVGYMMRTAAGSIFERILDDLMNQLPGLRVVYNASKLAVDTAIGGTDELQAPVKLETWDGLRMTAFKTGKSTPDGRDVLFLPTSPNITTGFVVEVDPEKYTETNERVEDALTRILSAGFGDAEDVGRSPEALVEDLDLGEPEEGDGVATIEEDGAATNEEDGAATNEEDGEATADDRRSASTDDGDSTDREAHGSGDTSGFAGEDGRQDDGDD